MISFPLAAALAPSPSPPLASSLRSLVIVAAGGRDLQWSPLRVATVLSHATRGRLVQRLFHGDARGADAAIAAAAERLGWLVEPIPAQWSRYGPAAGPIRNRLMLQRAIEEASSLDRRIPTAVLVIALPGQRGTASLLQQAQRLQRRSPLPIALLDLAAS